MHRRTARRKSVTLEAVVACPRFGLIRGCITDLSHGGMYLRAETAIVPIGATVSVTFRPHPASERCVTADGHVVHQSLQGFGIAFDRVTGECCEAISTILPASMVAAESTAPTRLGALRTG